MTYRVQADESNDASALERAVSPATDVIGGIRLSCFRSLNRAFYKYNHKQKRRQPLFPESALCRSFSVSFIGVSTSANGIS